jgi:ubiquinone biosynthesis protein
VSSANLRSRLRAFPNVVDVDPEPFASASIAQVHLGRDASDGAPVAVKVLKRDVAARVEADLSVARFLAGLARAADVEESGRLAGAVSRFERAILAELDLPREAAAASAAARALEASVGASVVVPRVRHAAPGVIVMDHVPSRPVASAADPARAADLVFESVMVLVCSGCAFHRDPHEGNLGVAGAAPGGGPESLVVYDFGAVASLSPGTLDALMEVALSLVARDARALAGALLERGLVAADDPGDPEVRREAEVMALQAFRYMDTHDAFGSFDPAELRRDVAHRLELSEECEGLLRAFVMADGVCRKVHPGFDLWRSVDRFLAIHGPRLALRRGLRDLGSML